MSEREKDTDGCELFDEHEWTSLLAWVDTLTLSELEMLKKYYDEFVRPKQ